MAQLSSPGVSVSVIDESFYTPAAPGTVPLIIVASEENKSNGAGTGTAPGTLAANAGKVYLLTSQKDLADTFGTPTFKTDANNNPIHAGEQNEYGLQAAYSFLGVSNRAYVVRANIDVGQLDAASAAPTGEAEDGQIWFDTVNSNFGVFQWNSATALSGGQTFTNKIPLVITSSAFIDVVSDGPKASIGAVGDYAVVLNSATSTNLANTGSTYTLWFKKQETASSAGWVEVGSTAWIASWPVAQSSISVTSMVLPNDGTITLAGDGFDEDILVDRGVEDTNQQALTNLVESINTNSNLGEAGITAYQRNGKLEIYSEGADVSISYAGSVDVGIDEATAYKAPQLKIDPHYTVPEFKRSNFNPSASPSGVPTGAVWVKTTEPNLGARWRIKTYSASTGAWNEISAPIYKNSQEALKGLDPSGGGSKLATGALYVKSNISEVTVNNNPEYANFRIYARKSAGTTSITSSTPGTISAGTFVIAESVKNSTVLSDEITVAFAGGDADAFIAKLQTELSTSTIDGEAYSSRVTVSKNTEGRIVITHLDGGDIHFRDTVNTPIGTLFPKYHMSGSSYVGTVNMYEDTDAVHGFVASLWTPFANIKAQADAPSTEANDGQLWYNSMVDEVDIMIHNGTTWVGYQNYSTGYADTNASGPIVSATKPTTQSTGDNLVNGDLWVDTSDLENYPKLFKWNSDLQKWLIVDDGDQTTDEGILFADARWATSGDKSDPSTITDLLTSDYLDADAPDPALYPKGMLLWNLRRSGFNVKKFIRNYVDVTADNNRNSENLGESMSSYYPHRWVSEASNQENGAGTFGRKAQRKVVIQALQALVNANQQIRDEESRVFNLIACPGYPELIGELVNLNYDRGLTAFVVADTPARLTPDATTLSNWGNNVNLALEDNDNGLVTSDEYLGVFYPWGYTSDNLGNNVVVPPSHMMLRTIALNDQVSYPWFAPAGTRRGGITNASAVGYIDAEGEFQSVALNTGQRDTLASIKVNPITFITGTGLVNYGQYTRAKNASALDRINVARLVVYLRRQFALLAKPYVFEPNDKITRDEIKGAAESLLLELVGQRALYDYIVVCDTSNNTPARIDRNELYLDVAIEPVKAVEFIYIPLRLKNTGEIKGLTTV